MEFHRVQHGKMSPIHGGVRNAKFLKQKKAFSNRLMNNYHQFFSNEGTLLGFRFFPMVTNYTGDSSGQPMPSSAIMASSLEMGQPRFLRPINRDKPLT